MNLKEESSILDCKKRKEKYIINYRPRTIV
jgi:hypothetical protein